MKEAGAADVDALQRTLEALAELELSSRGNTELAEETAALRAIDAITAEGRARRDGPRRALLGVGARAGAQLRGARLLPRARVAMQRAALDGLVDRPHELAVLGVGGLGVASLDRDLQAAEVGLDRRRVAAVLEALALRAEDALLL